MQADNINRRKESVMSYWEVHGIFGGFFFALFLLLFPRLTILFSVSVVSIATHIAMTNLGLPALIGWPLAAVLTIIGFVAWLAAPRLLIAVAAASFYLLSNTVLTLIALILGIFFTMKAWVAYRVIFSEMKKSWNTVKSRRTHEASVPTMKRRAQEWWEVLGVGRDASEAAIKSAYRKIAMQTHPDTAGANADPERLQQATDAYNEASGKK